MGQIITEHFLNRGTLVDIRREVIQNRFIQPSFVVLDWQWLSRSSTREALPAPAPCEPLEGGAEDRTQELLHTEQVPSVTELQTFLR